MGKKTKILILALLLLLFVIHGIHIPSDRVAFSPPPYPLPRSILPEPSNIDLKPAPLGKGPDGLYATWAAVYVKGLGKEASGSGESGMRLTFAPDKLVWSFDTPQGQKSYDAVYHIEPAKVPKEIDLGEPGQPAPKKMMLGIYKIEGNKLDIFGGVERPKKFGDSPLIHLELKRVKPRP